jgi:hypothetical protein
MNVNLRLSIVNTFVLACRRYPVGLEPVGERVSETSSATGKSAVSHKFVMSEAALAKLLTADLSGLGTRPKTASKPAPSRIVRTMLRSWSRQVAVPLYVPRRPDGSRRPAVNTA